MIKDYSFKEIEKYLKSNTDIGQDIFEAFDKLSDAAIIFSPIIFGPQYLPLLELLNVKNKLVDLGRKVYGFMTKKVELDYIKRTECSCVNDMLHSASKKDVERSKTIFANREEPKATRDWQKSAVT